MTHSVTDEIDRALEALHEMGRIQPDDAEAHYLLSRGYHPRQQWQQALAYLLQAKRVGYLVAPDLKKALDAAISGRSKP